MARDNFSAAVIRKLRDRVNSLCSNPNCRATTQAPGENDLVNSIGVAAHIAAASLGGPRYDERMSSAQRKSIRNAIWLCANCSIKIDRNAKSYPVELLNKWKSIAEQKAKAEQGRRLPNENDAIDTLTQALSGFPKRHIASSIANTHRASESALRMLDARFQVSTQYINGAAEYHISANEPVELTVSGADEYWAGLKNLIDNGTDFSVSAQAITIEGSQLFEVLLNDFDNGVLSVSARKIESILKIWLIQNNTNVIEAFDDIRGDLSIGVKIFQFNGEGCGGIFNVKSSGPTTAAESGSNITFTIDYEKWDKKDIKNLPYFEKIFSFLEKLCDGWTLCTRLEINGISVWSGERILLNGEAPFLDMLSFLHYTKCCSLIAKKSEMDICFDSSVFYTSKQHKRIKEIANGMSGKITKPPTARIKVTNLKTLEETILSGCSVPMKMIETIKEDIELFKTPCVISEKTIYMSAMTPKIDQDVEKSNNCDELKILFIPDADCDLHVCFNVVKK